MGGAEDSPLQPWQIPHNLPKYVDQRRTLRPTIQRLLLCKSNPYVYSAGCTIKLWNLYGIGTFFNQLSTILLLLLFIYILYIYLRGGFFIFIFSKKPLNLVPSYILKAFTGFLSGKYKNILEYQRDLGKNLMPTLLDAWKVWPAVNFVSMYLLPEMLWVPAGNVVGYFYNTLLMLKLSKQALAKEDAAHSEKGKGKGKGKGNGGENSKALEHSSSSSAAGIGSVAKPNVPEGKSGSGSGSGIAGGAKE